MRFVEGKFEVEDHQSVNGTFVNGDRIIAATPVRDGDTLTFDEFRFRFRVMQPPPPPPLPPDDDYDPEDDDKTAFLR